MGGLVLRRIQLLGLRTSEAMLHGRADLRGFVVQTKRGIYLPRVPFDPYNDLLQLRANDNLPLMFSWRPHYRLTVRMATPGLSVPTPRPVHLRASGVADYRAQLKRTPKGFVATYQLRQFRKQYTGDSRELMIEFHRRLEFTRSQWHLLRREGP